MHYITKVVLIRFERSTCLSCSSAPHGSRQRLAKRRFLLPHCYKFFANTSWIVGPRAYCVFPPLPHLLLSNLLPWSVILQGPTHYSIIFLVLFHLLIPTYPLPSTSWQFLLS